MSKYLKYKFVIVMLVFSTSMFAQEVFKVGNVYPGEIEMGGFNLSEDTVIEIEGEGASFDKWDSYLDYYAWILKTDTREVVWRSKDSEDFDKSEGEYDFDSELKLKAGMYEVYFAAGRDKDEYFVDGLGMIQGLFNERKSNFKKFQKRFFISISNEENIFTVVNPSKLVDRKNNSIVSLLQVGDSENLKKGFSLKEKTKISIYGIGEGVRSEFYDFGYIYDVANNKKVWMFNSSDGKYAGGGKKNIVERAEIVLPKGSYYVHYKSDDSHSFDEWNVSPPDDPQYWGILVSLVDESDRKNIIPFRKTDVVKPIIDITRVEEDELLSKGFTLSKSLELRIMAIGEGYKSLADYGWILNADTKEVVWKMSSRNTEYAGGAKKNRIADETIEFNAGNYIVSYVTDDSHNYDDWNDSPPFEEDKWGITIWTVNKNDKDFIKFFNSKNYKSKNLIAEITKVDDDKKLVKSFKISKNSDVRIIAIGESSGDELADYAWITDENDYTIWKMKYRETSHAGGANKNRLFNEVISIKAGEYKLHFKTDDSHSFEEWNSTPPDNPQMYGVTLIFAK